MFLTNYKRIFYLYQAVIINLNNDSLLIDIIDIIDTR